MKQANIIIIGSGIAALQLANTLSKSLNVMILTKEELTTSNSYMAQGGIAAAVGLKDDPYCHYLDTLEAGAHHNNAEAVLAMTKEAPELIKSFWQSGCQFDLNQHGELLLGMEGAHSTNRIVHSGGDATGRHMVDFLLANLDGNICVEHSVQAYELLLDEQKDICVGVKGKLPDGTIEHYYADHVVLATGGCGQLYSFTSNAATATGDGMAMAYMAGAELADMEFIQFHPTLLFVDGKTCGLVSEAVRGEGAVLVTGDGTRIMEGVHPLKDLAPRHIVSQTIYDFLKNGIQIYLDISSVDQFYTRFPTISKLCEDHGVRLDKGLIPVVPGSHFIMGGVKTDLVGRTTIEGLYAIGEVACTGIHGANRLASNSLLEGLFIGRRLAEWLNSNPDIKAGTKSAVPKKKYNMAPANLPEVHLLKRTMMDGAGIVRTKHALAAQKEWLDQFGFDAWLGSSLDDLTPDELSQLFLYITACLVTESALERTESRGGHYRLDFPKEDNANWMKKQIILKRITVKDGKHEYNQAALAT